jgi:hypothetical protein
VQLRRVSCSIPRYKDERDPGRWIERQLGWWIYLWRKGKLAQESNTGFSVASLTSKRSTRHHLSPADSGTSGSSGDDRSGERSRDRSSDRSRERSRGSCSRGPRQVPGRQDPMFADVGHDTDLPTARWRLRFPSRSRGVTDPSSRATSGTPSSVPVSERIPTEILVPGVKVPIPRRPL